MYQSGNTNLGDREEVKENLIMDHILKPVIMEIVTLIMEMKMTKERKIKARVKRRKHTMMMMMMMASQVL